MSEDQESCKLTFHSSSGITAINYIIYVPFGAREERNETDELKRRKFNLMRYFCLFNEVMKLNSAKIRALNNFFNLD